MNARDLVDRVLDVVIDVLSAPFDFLQRHLGATEDPDNPHDPTLWL